MDHHKKTPANNGSPNEQWVNNNRTNALERAAADAADLSAMDAFLVPYSSILL